MHATDTAARFAASNRPWPARMVPGSSIRIGLVQTRWMLFIKRAIWHSGCCLGLPGNCFKSPIARQPSGAGLALLCIGEIADLVCKLRVRSFTPRSNQLAKPRRGAKNAGTMRELFVCRYLSFVAICRELNSRQIPTQLYVPYGRYRERRRIPRQGPFPACCSIPPRYVDLAECRSS